MATRQPVVVLNDQHTPLPAADKLPGGSISISTDVDNIMSIDTDDNSLKASIVIGNGLTGTGKSAASALKVLVDPVAGNGLTVTAAGLKVVQAPAIVVPSGVTVDALTAAPGNYYFEIGSILQNGPNDSNLQKVYKASLTVYENNPMRELKIIAYHTQSGGNNHVSSYVLFDSNGQGIIWSRVGPGDSTNPAASKAWTMEAI